MSLLLATPMPKSSRPIFPWGAANRWLSESRGKEMRTEVFWIHAPLLGRLAIMPRPRAGEWLDDEVVGWRAEGVDTVVSLLELSEILDWSRKRS
jgi:hypothetical protein